MLVLFSSIFLKFFNIFSNAKFRGHQLICSGVVLVDIVVIVIFSSPTLHKFSLLYTDIIYLLDYNTISGGALRELECLRARSPAAKRTERRNFFTARTNEAKGHFQL